MMEKIIIIGGPTASGKSDLAINIAKNIGSEIISADSMQIYRDMNVGTAKVTLDEMQGIKHHMIDVVNADSAFSVSSYVDMVRPIISELNANGIVPVIVGGTGLYIDALIYDYEFNNADIDMKYRRHLEDIAASEGNEVLHKMLIDVDPDEAARIHPNNVKRVIRALEICRDGNKKSENKRTLRYDTLMYILNPERSVLYDRIDRRVDIMLEHGLECEVRTLLDKGLNFDMQSMQAIGYKEWRGYFEGDISLEDVRCDIQKNSRNYAKRQVTWFVNKYKDITHIVSNDDMDSVIDEARGFLTK